MSNYNKLKIGIFKLLLAEFNLNEEFFKLIAPSLVDSSDLHFLKDNDYLKILSELFDEKKNKKKK